MSYTVGGSISPTSVSGSCGTYYTTYWEFTPGCNVGSSLTQYYSSSISVPIGAPIYSIVYSAYLHCSGSVSSGAPAIGTATYYSGSMTHNPMVKCTSGYSDFSTTIYMSYAASSGSVGPGQFVAYNQETYYSTTINYRGLTILVTFEAPPVSGFFGAC